MFYRSIEESAIKSIKAGEPVWFWFGSVIKFWKNKKGIVQICSYMMTYSYFRKLYKS